MDSHDIDRLVGIDIRNDEQFLHLTPNENVISEFARTYNQRTLGARYNFGPAYNGQPFTLYGSFTSLAKEGINELISTTEQLLNERMASTNVLFAPLSGLHAMMIAILATTAVGDTIFCLPKKYGAHFATQSVSAGTGRMSKEIPFDKQTLDIDYDAFAQLISEQKGGYIVYLDTSYSLIPFDVARIKQMIGDHVLIYDASHTLGLMIGEQFPNPLLAGADIITANTHKTLPGSHKGILLFRDQDLFARVDAAGHAYYSSIHLDHMITLCISINEMIRFGKDYASAVITMANAFGDELASRGLQPRKADASKWTYTHQLHLPIAGMGTVEVLAQRLFGNNIAVAFDDMFEQGPFIRFGLQEVTRRGITNEQLGSLAQIIADTCAGKQTKQSVTALVAQLQHVHYSYDNN